MTKMRCHYEVLHVERKADDDTIKKAYRKLAVKWHPDKNLDDPSTAAERFKEIAAAYECLSDARERRWYDDHRADILAGGDGASSDSDSEPEAARRAATGRTKLRKREVNLWSFFKATCFEGFEGPTSFYAVYGAAFRMVESAEEDGWDPVPFGHADAPWADVKRFYDTFCDFQSKRSFAEYDKWHVGDDQSRYVRRAAEQENKRERSGARKTYHDMVRSLALHCKRRDPRIAERTRAVAREKAEKEERDKAKKEAQREAHKAAREAWRREQQDEALAGYETHIGALVGDMEEAAEETEAVVVLFCEACNKKFKSEKQFFNHCQSKAHKKKAGSAPTPTKFDADYFDKGDPAFEPDPPAVAGHDADEETSDDRSDSDSDSDSGSDSDSESTDDDNAADDDDDAPGRRGEAPPAKPTFPPPPPADDDDDASASSSSDDGAAAAAAETEAAPPLTQPSAVLVADDTAGDTAADDAQDTAPREKPVVDEPTPAPTKKKSRRRAKEKAAQPAAEPTQAQAAPQQKKKKKGGKRRGDSSDDDAPSCAFCNKAFPSRSRLFAHLKEFPAHARLKT